MYSKETAIDDREQSVQQRRGEQSCVAYRRGACACMYGHVRWTTGARQMHACVWIGSDESVCIVTKSVPEGRDPNPRLRCRYSCVNVALCAMRAAINPEAADARHEEANLLSV